MSDTYDPLKCSDCGFYDCYGDCTDKAELGRLRAENSRLRSALEFYASHDHQVTVTVDIGGGMDEGIDFGDRAREVLESLKTLPSAPATSSGSEDPC